MAYSGSQRHYVALFGSNWFTPVHGASPASASSDLRWLQVANSVLRWLQVAHSDCGSSKWLTVTYGGSKWPTVIAVAPSDSQWLTVAPSDSQCLTVAPSGSHTVSHRPWKTLCPGTGDSAFPGNLLGNVSSGNSLYYERPLHIIDGLKFRAAHL